MGSRKRCGSCKGTESRRNVPWLKVSVSFHHADSSVLYSFSHLASGSAETNMPYVGIRKCGEKVVSIWGIISPSNYAEEGLADDFQNLLGMELDTYSFPCLCFCFVYILKTLV